ncbi:MAG: hypothetical protein HFG75_11225 [Hungatella sp.]|nr:hypothetical protein [Hungatella sp.]
MIQDGRQGKSMKVKNSWNLSVAKAVITTTSKAASKKRAGSSTSKIRRKLERIKQKLRAGVPLTASEKAFLCTYAPGLYSKAVALERECEEHEKHAKRRAEYVKKRRQEEAAKKARDQEDQEKAARADQDRKEYAKELLEQKEEAEEQAAEKQLQRQQTDREQAGRREEEEKRRETAVERVRTESRAETKAGERLRTKRQAETETAEEKRGRENRTEKYWRDQEETGSVDRFRDKETETKEQGSELERGQGIETKGNQDSSQLMREFEADVFFRNRMPASVGERGERIPSLVLGRAAYETVSVADQIWKESTPQTSKKA